MDSYITVPGLPVSIRINDVEPSQVSEGLRKIASSATTWRDFTASGVAVHIDFDQVTSWIVASDPLPGTRVVLAFRSSINL